MIPAPLPVDESARLESLHRLEVLDTPIEERFERIARMAGKLLGVPMATVSLVDAERQWFKCVHGFDATQTPRSVSFCGYTILEDELMVVSDATRDARFHDSPLVTGDPHVAFYAGCPVHSPDGSRVGALCVMDCKPRRLSQEDRQTLRDLAGLVETELRETILSDVQRRLIRQLDAQTRAALIDPLTRLWRREGVIDLMGATLARVAAGELSMAAIMIDVDRFKTVNDTLGHPAGDEVLRECARRLLSGIRDSDAIGRFGGEEFLVMVTSPESEDAAVRIAERIRQRVAEAPIHIKDRAVPLTVSLGLVHVPAGTQIDQETVIDRADRALLQAKRQGRDRLVCAADPLAMAS